jgi:hypothetical protein
VYGIGIEWWLRTRKLTASSDMSSFANRAAFEEARSRLIAIGTDLSPARAIVDASGNVLAHARTGGMLDPKRYELEAGSTIYRFGGPRAPKDVAKGGWWIEKREFQLLVNFAISNDIYVGLAMRVLCLVPPEWRGETAQTTMLLRGRVEQDLLAWRGLGNSVVTPMKGKGFVRLPHQNEISARRLHQLYIPGLAEPGGQPMVSIEDVRCLDPRESTMGFLYL